MAKVLYATFTAQPGQEDRVARLIAGLAEQVRQEPGSVTFDAHQVEGEPQRFFVYEVYADEAAFEAHIAAPYGATFNAELNPLIVEPNSQLTFLVPVDA